MSQTGLTAIQEDACSGIAILYMGREPREVDEYVARLHIAMESGNVEEAEHVSAVMVGVLARTLSDESLTFVTSRWTEAFICVRGLEPERMRQAEQDLANGKTLSSEEVFGADGAKP